MRAYARPCEHTGISQRGDGRLFDVTDLIGLVSREEAESYLRVAG